MRSLPMIACIIAVVALPAVAEADDMGGMNQTKMDQSGPADKAFMESMQKMMKNMDVKPTGNADKDFVLMMMPHHVGAVDMAKVELQYGKDPVLRKMAAHIVEAQEGEIREMKGWLAKNGK